MEEMAAGAAVVVQGAPGRVAQAGGAGGAAGRGGLFEAAAAAQSLAKVVQAETAVAEAGRQRRHPLRRFRAHR
jgi:hypothetical protein